MHDDVQPNYIVDSHADYTSDSNMIPYDQYVKDNVEPVVQSNVSYVPNDAYNDAYMMIINEMHEQTTQSVSTNEQNKVVNASLTAKLATYKEQVKLYYRFDVGLHEAMMSLGVGKLKDEVVCILARRLMEVAAMADVLRFATLLSLIFVGVLSLSAQRRTDSDDCGSNLKQPVLLEVILKCRTGVGSGNKAKGRPRKWNEALEIPYSYWDGAGHLQVMRVILFLPSNLELLWLPSDIITMENVTRATNLELLCLATFRQFYQMVNTRQSTPEFSGPAFDEAVQRAVNALLPCLTTQITNELRQNGDGSSGVQPPTIHTWLERFGKQKPRSFSSATTLVDAENWIAHIEKLFEVLGCADEFKARLASYKLEGDALSWWKAYFLRSEQQKYEREYHTILQRDGEPSGEFMKRFLRLAGFLGKKAGTQEEQAKNFKWALCDWILDRIVNTEFTDVAQVPNAARNIEILRERSGQNNKRNRDGDRIRPMTQGNNQRGMATVIRSHDITEIGSTTVLLGLQDRRVTGACFICGLTGHMARDCPKNGGNGGRGYGNDNQPAAKGRVFSSTKDQATNSSGSVWMHPRAGCYETPLWTEQNINIRPLDYSKENYLATFTPQIQLTPKQIFWSKDVLTMKAKALKEQTKVSRPIKALTVYPPNTPATVVPGRITPTSLTEGERGFKQTKECYLTEVIPFFKTLKEHFEGIQKALTKEIKEMKEIFEELEAEVDQNVVNRKYDEIERKNLLIVNDNLIADCLSKEVFYTATNSELTVSRFTEMHDAHTVVQARCLELKAELSKLHDKVQKDDHTELVKRFFNLETRSEADRTLDFRALDFQITHLTEKITVLQEQNELFRAENAKIKQHYKELYDSIKITRAKHIEQTTALLTENKNLKAQIHENMKCITMDSVKPRVLAPGRYAIDVEPIPPRNRNNMEVYLDYLKHLKESVETLREIVDEGKVERPLDRSLAFACLYTKHSQELLEYVIGTCPKDFNKQDKKHASTPLNKKKQVTFEDQCDTSNKGSFNTAY
ncbi:integrase, catalytic region, zinc finger, CCHC-type containing protein [Tanacetum coccineum]